MSWFKPMKPLPMDFAPFDKMEPGGCDHSALDAILQAQQLPHTGHSILSLVTQRQQQNDTLGLTLKLPAGYQASSEADFEQLHATLLNALQGVGIAELNLHLVTQKARSPQQAQTSVSGASSTPHQHQHQHQSQFQTQLQHSPRPAPASQPSPALPPVTNASASAVAPASGATPPAGQQRAAPPVQQELAVHPRIQHIIVVASGKGGVGKSTTTVNLALALQQTGARVGVLDADIYGPSIPAMLGIAGQTPLIEHEQFVPLEAFGMAVLSIGNLTGDDSTPIVWRGPKATGALMQLFNQTAWPQLDYLLIDMPPGTGDIQLTLAQRIPVTGAVIVTTPQHIALLDAQKGIALFNKVNIPVLGVIENMATHVCSQCGHEDAVFGSGGGEQLSGQYQIPLLGRLPLDATIRQQADAGKPSVAASDGMASHYQQIALAMLVQLARVPPRQRDSQRIF